VLKRADGTRIQDVSGRVQDAAPLGADSAWHAPALLNDPTERTMNGPAIALALSLIAAAGFLYLAVCIVAAHRFARTRSKAQMLRLELRDLNEQRVQFPVRDGRPRIDARYLAAQPHEAAVVLLHGNDACHADELKSPTFALAQRLLDSGISVLMIGGHGTSSAARAARAWREHHDVLGAVDYLLDRGYAPGRIGVLGASMGAAASLLAAADEEAIGPVVADGAFADFDQMIRLQYAKLAGTPSWLLPGALAIARLWTGVDLREVRPLARAHAMRGRPVLLILS
jgi:hypothetical protein